MSGVFEDVLKLDSSGAIPPFFYLFVFVLRIVWILLLLNTHELVSYLAFHCFFLYL